ncbi:MAG TPA: asparaginase domain-containing protein [Thermoanaerobaculia bacterium]|jgi:L-asparaginase|nr:asparaginase domain-containing protein [Thermoanaerobaculia bacterium]
MSGRRIALVTTGGTIEKTYDERSGELVNRRSIVQRMLEELRLEDTAIEVVELMTKDSLDLIEEDRAQIAAKVRSLEVETPGRGPSGVVILHGTDTLEQTGERLYSDVPTAVPIVLTGAMRPFEMKQSDALQNLTEAIFATGVLSPGIWCVAHGRALRFPGVRKDRALGTFVGGA